jgi:hypothetical protein
VDVYFSAVGISVARQPKTICNGDLVIIEFSSLPLLKRLAAAKSK